MRDCADQLRRLHGISIYITNRERLGDIYIVTARAKDKTGREDESTGAVALGTLKGDALCNALMKCETKAKRRVTLSLAGLGWLDETELETIPGVRVGEPNGDAPAPPLYPGEGGTTRLTADQARDLKKLAQAAFGYAEGSRKLRQDLGFEPDESLTLRHLAAHVTFEQYQTLMDGYGQVLRQVVESDLPDFPPPAAHGQGPPPEPPPDERLRWGALSRRSMQVGLSATTWEALRQGDYAAAERVIVALEGPGAS